jgi:hypothetical protein
MQQEGPQLERLLRRMSECPEDFLEPPAHGKQPGIDVVAIVCDQIRALRAEPPPEAESHAIERIRTVGLRRQQFMALVAWLFCDDWFLARPALVPAMWPVYVSQELAHLADVVQPATAVHDADRREELVRTCLRGLGLRPEGETETQAQDRLAMLDSAERQRVLRATAAAERRAREIREAMARAAAQDAASRYGE